MSTGKPTDFEFNILNSVSERSVKGPKYNPNTSNFYNLERRLSKSYFTENVLASRSQYRAIVLRVESTTGSPADLDNWFSLSAIKKLFQSGIPTLQVLRVRIPELHAACPLPPDFGDTPTTADETESPEEGAEPAAPSTASPSQGIINNFYPIVVAQSTAIAPAKAGDVVYVDFGDRVNLKDGVYLGPVINNLPAAGYGPASAGGAFGGAAKFPPANTVPCGGSYLTLMRENSKALGIKVEAAFAVLQTESGQKTFCPNGRMLTRFEPYSFIKQVKRAGVPESVRRTIPWYNGCHGNRGGKCPLFKQATSKCAGNWDATWGRNMKIAFDWCKRSGVDEEYVYRSASYGAPQVMGFNHKALGYSSAKEMFHAFAESEVKQLEGMFNYFKNKGCVTPLRSLDWKTAALRYNGSSKSIWADNFKRNYNRFVSNGLPPDRQLVCHEKIGSTAKESEIPSTQEPAFSDPDDAPTDVVASSRSDEPVASQPVGAGLGG